METLRTLYLSDMDPVFCSGAMFVTDNIQECFGRLSTYTHVYRLIKFRVLVPVVPLLSSLNRKLNANFTQSSSCCFIFHKNYKNEGYIYFEHISPDTIAMSVGN